MSLSSTEMKNNEELNKLALNKLRDFYNNTMLPVEEITQFKTVVATELRQADFESAPVVLVLGP